MAVRPDSTMGYRTGSKMLVIFMFAFFFMGYTPFLSICLGAIAGLTSGFLSSWWHAKEDFVTDEVTGKPLDKEPTTATTSERRPVRYGFGVRTARGTSAPRSAWGVGRFFRRNRS